jgi:hypothetical protein
MTSNTESYDQEQNTVVDSTRGNLLTDVQMSAESVPMTSTATQMALNDTTHHDIKSILERPVNLGTYEWKAGDAALEIQLKPSDYDADTQNYLKKFNFPQDIFTNSPIVVDKLKNYQYFKSDIEIEVKINAQPFLQGALMLVYNPYYDQVGDFRRKGTRFLASQTSCPYKIVSVEEGNSLKITCPYANIYDMFDLSNSQNQFGTVFLYVFSKLLGPVGNETAKYTVFARFVNPQFSVPTSKDVLATYRDTHDINRLVAKGYRVAQSSVSPVAAQDTGEVEARGPVSKLASGVTTVADVLSGIPVIGQMASTVAWVSRAIGKTAATFGLSKPITIVPQQVRVIKPNQTLIHTEGHDDSTTLALLQDNGIDGSSFIPENKDEMALSYIFGRPNYFHSKAALADTFSARKLITKWEVSPFSVHQTRNVENIQTMYLGSFAYASMQATLWRGTINYDIMVVKTPFHQGRFAVVFFPETNLADIDDTSANQLGNLLNTNYNVVCNLKDRQDENGRTTFRVSVPYISNTDWRETYKRNELGPDPTTLDTKTGCLAIYSVVDLSNPPTVSSQVTFFVAHSGGDDYQVSRPTISLAPGFQNRYAQSDVGAFIVPADENLLVPSHTTRDVTAQTTGEYFLSLRALSKRFNFLAFLNQVSEFIGIRTRNFTEDPTSGVRTMSQQSFHDEVSPTSWYMSSFLYRFYNGSSMLKVLPPQTGMITESYLRFDEDLESVKIFDRTDAIGQPIFQQLQAVSCAYEIRTPYYRGIRADVVGSTQIPVLNDVRTCIRSQNRGGFGNTTAPSYIYEAAGDDFNFFFMVGPPPMMDIKNVTKIATFPTGTERSINCSLVDTINDLSTSINCLPVTFVPDIAVDSEGGITTSDTEFVTVTYSTPTSSEQVRIIDCKVANIGGVSVFTIPVNPLLTVDLATTTTSVASLGTFNIIDSAESA